MNEHTDNQASQPAGSGFTEQTRINLPNASTVLLLGILSIIFSFWYFSLAGIIMGVIALYIAGKDLRLYAIDPSRYTLSSFNNIKAGRVCAIIGLVVASIFILLIGMIIFGIVATLPFWGMID